MTEPNMLFPMFVTGRLAEAVTGRSLTPRTMTLETLHGVCLRPVPVLMMPRPDGRFALCLAEPGPLVQARPDDPVTLRLTATLEDGRRSVAHRVVSGASLGRIQRDVLTGNQTVRSSEIAGAPFALNLKFDPAPVSLYGTVIAYRDPSRPVADALVSAGDLGARTDRFGNFCLGPLPAQSSLVVNITKAGTSANYAFQPDFYHAVNLAAFSLDA